MPLILAKLRDALFLPRPPSSATLRALQFVGALRTACSNGSTPTKDFLNSPRSLKNPSATADYSPPLRYPWLAADVQAAQSELKQQNQQYTHEIAFLIEQKQIAEQKIQAYERELGEKNTSIIGTEKQLALLTEKARTLEKSLREAEDKIEALRQEKLFLAQEKAELQGILKQIHQPKNHK